MNFEKTPHDVTKRHRDSIVCIGEIPSCPTCKGKTTLCNQVAHSTKSVTQVRPVGGMVVGAVDKN